MFCTKIKTRLKGLLQQFDLYIDAHIDTALHITSALKRILSSPTADILTAIIPGTLDNIIQQQLISALDQALEALAIAEQCKQQTAINDKLSCFVQQLKQCEPQLQEATLQKLASLLAGHLDGQRLKQNLYDLYTQAKYSAAKPS
jgi:hypothetical protein